jgi:hypothetical protein
MIATGNHVDKGFAAQRTTPLESPVAHLVSAAHLNGQSLLFDCVFTISGGSALAALPSK